MSTSKGRGLCHRHVRFDGTQDGPDHRILSDCALLCADDDDTMAVLVGKDIRSKAWWA